MIRHEESGLTARVIEVGGRKVGLLEGGHGESVPVEAGQGRTLVYLHGFADLHGVKASPFPFHEALAQRARVVAPAHPGCADSDEYGDLDHVEDAVFHYLEVFDALGLERFDLVGHCIGGWIAAEFAVRHPERLHSLTLIGASGLFVPGAPIGDIFMMAQASEGIRYDDLRAMLFSAADHPLALELFPDGRGLIDDEVRRYQCLRLGSFIGFKPPYFYNRSLINRLHRISCPAQAIWGERDGMVPRAIGEAYAAGMGGKSVAGKGHGRPILIKGAGHACHLEQPDATAAAVIALLDGSDR